VKQTSSAFIEQDLGNYDDNFACTTLSPTNTRSSSSSSSNKKFNTRNIPYSQLPSVTNYTLTRRDQQDNPIVDIDDKKRFVVCRSENGNLFTARRTYIIPQWVTNLYYTITYN